MKTTDPRDKKSKELRDFELDSVTGGSKGAPADDKVLDPAADGSEPIPGDARDADEYADDKGSSHNEDGTIG